MISDELKELIRPVVLVQRIIWLVIVGSILFYIAFVYMITGQNKALTSTVGGYIEPLIYILAGVCVLGSIFYYRYALSEGRLSEFMSGELDIESLVANPMTKKMDESEMDKLNSLTKNEAAIYCLMYELQKVTIVVLILNELTAILGSVLAFVNDDFSKIIPFAIASLVLSFWMFPRHMSLIKRVQNL